MVFALMEVTVVKSNIFPLGHWVILYIQDLYVN